MRARRSRLALVTTDSDEAAIAAAAIIGESRIPVNGYSSPAAMGMPAVLYPNARMRFWRMLRMVALDSRTAVATPASDPDIRVTSAASMATSVPVPMASPTSARARAGRR